METEVPERGEPESVKLPVKEEAWRGEVVEMLRAILFTLGRIEVVLGGVVAGADSPELPEPEEPLGTWILEDARVAAIEAAIVQEQRVRGQVYGG